MTADHPIREERYAAVLHAMAVEDNPGHADWDDCATTGPCRDEGHRFAAALVAADPATTQPDAALSDEERTAVTCRVAREHERAPWGCACGAKFGDSIDAHWHLINQAVAAVERILAARAAQPVPAPEVCGECEDGCVHGTTTPCPRCRGRLIVPAPEVSRGVAEVKAEALREAADVIDAWKFTAEFVQWLHDRADRLVRDALGGERGDGA